MSIVIVGTGGQFQALPPGTAPASASALEHEFRVIDRDRRPVSGARLRIDSGVLRYADSGGRFRIPRTLLRDGTHTLQLSAPTFDELSITLTVRGALTQTYTLRRTTEVPDPIEAQPTGPITLTFGALPFDSPSRWAEIDPTSAGPATVTSDQPIADQTARSINATDYGIVCAVLANVPAGTAVEWTVTPSIGTTGPKTLWQAAGPSLIGWFTYTGTPHATGTYSISATVGAETFGPVVLTVA